MNPDAYMPYYGDKFEAAVKGYPSYVKWAYQSCLWHYWRHTHCLGIPNSNAYMQRISDCEPQQWEEIKAALFSDGGFFHLGTDGRWHQRFCSALYAEKSFKYSVLVEKSKNGAKKRWAHKAIPKAMPQALPKAQEEALLKGVPEKCQPEPDLSTYINRNSEIKTPTLEEVKAYASMQNISEEVAVKFWNHYESVGWIDGNHRQVVKWQSKLAGWKVGNETVHAPNGNGSKSSNSGAMIVVHSEELKRINEAIRKIVDGASRDAFGTTRYSDQEKEKLSKFKARRKELQDILGVTI